MPSEGSVIVLLPRARGSPDRPPLTEAEPQSEADQEMFPYLVLSGLWSADTCPGWSPALQSVSDWTQPAAAGFFQDSLRPLPRHFASQVVSLA